MRWGWQAAQYDGSNKVGTRGRFEQFSLWPMHFKGEFRSKRPGRRMFVTITIFR